MWCTKQEEEELTIPEKEEVNLNSETEELSDAESEGTDDDIPPKVE